MVVDTVLKLFVCHVFSPDGGNAFSNYFKPANLLKTGCIFVCSGIQMMVVQTKKVCLSFHLNGHPKNNVYSPTAKGGWAGAIPSLETGNSSQKPILENFSIRSSQRC